ncbi:hypothetical protein FSPOR_7619 [Fusarium sporotrichioides]|uniref:Uncharacterized protein n=1 Tax=Fusarium sporotrichioides TaxID=5514 RepID=A0A395RXK5_FUSSP|nr:hypothetical protein FSPOR_7619 [Fusarium sporotrichioides]
MDTETRVQLWLNAHSEQQYGAAITKKTAPAVKIQAAFTCGLESAPEQQQPVSHDAVGKPDDVVDHDYPIEEELLEIIVHHIFSHSILRPVRNLLVHYIRDQNAIKPIRSNPSLEVIADLPSMLFSTLPILISIWTLTSYCWIPLCGLMIWERTGSDVIYGFLCRILKGLEWMVDLMRGTYEIATMMNHSAVVSTGARRVLPWADGQMNDEGALGSLLYPHRGSS